MLIAACLVVIGALIWFLDASSRPVDAPDASLATTEPELRLGGGNGPRTVVATARPIPVEPGAFSEAQARVYAALGEVADGRRERLPNFDDETSKLIEPMRRQLATQPLHRGAGRPTISPGGASAQIGTGGIPTATSTAEEPARPTTSDVGTPLVAADGGRQLVLGNATGTVTSGVDGHIISGRQAWAAIKAKPGQGLPVRIIDRGEGGHVIAVFGDDFGSVRVNGGLVVPGRYYRITGSVEITSMAPIGVHIRPLNAVPSYHDNPLALPSANG